MPPQIEVTAEASTLLARLERLLGRHEGATKSLASPELQRANRARAIHGSLNLDGLSLTADQVTALLSGQQVTAPAEDLQAVENALRCHDLLPTWSPSSPEDLLEAHHLMMAELVARAGKWRTKEVEFAPEEARTEAPPSTFGLAGLVKKLLSWIEGATETPAPIRAAVCLYEFERIHPFQEGNRRLGLLWHRLLLSQHHPLFAQVPIEAAFYDRQSDYHETLAHCDHSGTATSFLEFALAITLDALTATQALPQARQVAPDRLHNAQSHFGAQSFRRKDYLALFPGLSTATASRDLQQGVESARLSKTGDKATTRYQFREAPTL